MNNIFFIELTDAYDSKVYVNIANVDWMEQTKEQVSGETRNYIRLHCGAKWVRVKETVKQIQEKINAINQNIS